ncbi:MAG TPA: amino acid ABC transporter substrate-binding protein [Pseudolabrys sp.]|jgi:branched-chain amino acid transport system substrate-binding protein|nr:amino acid ABC transporter substrate-binding protein [Pseudolabrys sp.]
MLNTLKLRAFAFVAAAAFAVAGVASPASAQDKNPIKIGFSMALTGGLAANGKQALLGAKIWEEDVNKNGGLLGRPVKLVYYDDQSTPSNVPSIYTKLLDVDKVDLVVGPYATAMIAPAMPVIIAKGKVFIGLFGLAVNSKFHYPKYFAMIPSGPDTKPSFTEGVFQVAAKQKPKPKTVSLAWSDLEFSKNACEGARINSKKYGFKIIYDRSYPPTTTDFSPIVRALQNANADIVIICSYPNDSVGMLNSIKELNYRPKMLGGAMVGLQATVFKQKLGPALNGIINYETWVPSMATPTANAFLKVYQSRAKSEGVDPLGYYLGTWGYAYLELLADAVKATKSLDDDKIAAYMHSHTMKTIMGDITFQKGVGGEWAKSRMLQVQYHDIKPGADLETWKGMSYQTVLTPPDLKTGDVIYPYEKALK